MDERLTNITPEQIGFIVLLAILVIVGREVLTRRESWQPWVAALGARYTTHLPATPEQLADRPAAPVAQVQQIAPAPLAPRTDGAARAHAEYEGAEGARTAPAPLDSGALTPDLVGMMRAIAGHKLQAPGDKKEATAKALGISKSGTSKRYAMFSAAWSMLYPEPVAPARPEYITEREDRINRELAAESQAS